MKTILFSEDLEALTIIDISELERTMLEDGYFIKRRHIGQAPVVILSDDPASTTLSLDYEIRPLRFKLPAKTGVGSNADLVRLVAAIDEQNWLKAKESVPEFLPHQVQYLKYKYGIDV